MYKHRLNPVYNPGINVILDCVAELRSRLISLQLKVQLYDDIIVCPMYVRFENRDILQNGIFF